MSIKTYIQMEGEKITKLELSMDELVDDALETNYAQDYDVNIYLHSFITITLVPKNVAYNLYQCQPNVVFEILFGR